MAMLLLKDIFYNTWKDYLDNFEAEEFWSKVKDKTNLIMIAECYWDTEIKLLELGFHYTYNKKFLDSILALNINSIRNLLCLNSAYQRRMVRFLENHDEPRIASFLNEQNSLAIITLFFTSLGLKLIYHEQLEGQTIRIPLHIIRSIDHYKPIPQYSKLLKIYNQIKDFINYGKYFFFPVSAIFDNSFTNLISYGYLLDNQIVIVVINLSSQYSQGIINLKKAILEDDKEYVLTELISNTNYIRRLGQGLHVILNPYEAQIFIAKW